MPKGRRERDRPKIQPDSSYNPYKRVVLNYDSGDEVQEDGNSSNIEHSNPSSSNQHDRQHTATSDVTKRVIVRKPEDYDHVKCGPAAVSNEQTTLVGAKESQQHQPRHGRKEANEGQRIMFGSGGLGSGIDQWDACYEADTADALAYLQAVKTERETIPEVLVSKEARHNFAEQDEALNDTDEADDYEMHLDDNWDYEHGDEMFQYEAACSAYTESLLARFDALHSAIEDFLSAESRAALDPSKLHFLDASKRASRTAWKRMIRRHPPHINQLRAMSPDTAREALNLIQSTYLQPGRQITPLTSTWLMSLMARLEEYPRMHMEKVGMLRSLAKQAVTVKRLLEQEEPSAAILPDSRVQEDTASIRSSSPESDTGGGHGDDHARFSNTIATLDMILVIIAERFGQRDFLSERTWPELWTES